MKIFMNLVIHKNLFNQSSFTEPLKFKLLHEMSEIELELIAICDRI